MIPFLERFRLPSRKRPAGPTGNDQRLIPDVNANLWSWMTYGWITGMLKVGYTRQLQPEDMWQLDEGRHCANRSKILQDSFYMNCPEELRPHHMRSSPAPVRTMPADSENASTITPDSKETLKEVTDASDEKHMFTDPFEAGKTYAGGLEVPSPPAPRRSSGISRESIQRERDREASFERETCDLRYGCDPSRGAFDIDPQGDDVLSRIETRISIHSASDDVDGTATGETGEKDATALNKVFLKAMFNTVRGEIIRNILSKGLYSTLIITSTLVLRGFLNYITLAYDHAHTGGAPPPSIGVGIGYAIGLVMMQEVAYLSIGVSNYSARQSGWILRTAIWDAVSNKSLRLSPRARLEMTRGRMVAMFSADCSLIEDSMQWINSMILDPWMIVGAAGVLIYTLGPSALVGLAMMTSCCPLTTIIVKKMLKARRHQLREIDGRTSLMTEVLHSVRSVKLYAYENHFVKRLLVFREAEMSFLRRYLWWRSSLQGLTNMSPILATILTFVTYAVTGHDLSVARIFSALQLFNVISGPMRYLPYAVASVMDGYVASKRICAALIAEDMAHGLQIDPSAPEAVRFEGSFTFEVHAKRGDVSERPQKLARDRKRDRLKGKFLHKEIVRTVADEQTKEVPFQLNDFRLSIPRGSLVCVVGRVGSGKSAFAQACVGEMRPTTGRVLFSGPVGYFQQNPWIQSCSLRENILFGKDEDLPRLVATIRACALEPDIEALDDGLETEIGERGVTLSGGQKARLQLARVVYSDPEIAVLDDPLAAVDSHVAKRLIDECICGVLASKTVVLITHHLDVLPKADVILVFEDGKIIQEGTYGALMQREGTFKDLIDDFGCQEAVNQDQEPPPGIGCAAKLQTPLDLTRKVGAGRGIFASEERFSGAASWGTYKALAQYIGSYWWSVLILALLTCGQLFATGTQLFLGFWTAGSIRGFRLGDYIAVYGALGISQSLIILIVCPILGTSILRASFRIFQDAIHGVMRSPLAFHDQNPLGRIISRLSKDVEQLDRIFAWQLYFFLLPVLAILGTIGLIIYSYSWLALLFIPIVALFFVTALFYKRSSVETKRLDNVMRSFIYSTFAEQLSGMACIRSHQREQHFVTKFQKAVDEECRVYQAQITMQRWLAIRIQTYGNILILAVTLCGIGFRETIPPSRLGVVLTSSMTAVGYLANLILEFVLLENSFNYVERLVHYATLPREAAASLPLDAQLGTSWPQSGRVEFQDVKMRYREALPLVLKGVSFAVEPGEKVGIVGRTGAGKSSLLQVLLRLVELAEGRILVDGQDLATLGLDFMRTQLSAIPQDSLLFHGTMRENLDPAGEHSDAVLHDVLRKCELIADDNIEIPAHVRKRLEKFKLDAEITTTGDNFSGGEKQLLALARAIVKNSRVILLDEATASVDPETDHKFQNTIRTQFKDNTILCIAHRLQTVAFYDKILVLDAGLVSEYGTPLDLYDQGGVFRSMCEAAELDRAGIERIRAGGS